MAKAKKVSATAAKAIRAFEKDFVTNLPPEADGGLFHATRRDRWSGTTHSVPDGHYRVGRHPWVFQFQGGAFVAAFAFRPTFTPEVVITVPVNG